MFKHQLSSIRNIEVQLGQLANVVTTRAQGHLPRNTKVKSKEHVKVISLKSGRELQEPKNMPLKVDEEKEQPEMKIDNV